MQLRKAAQIASAASVLLVGVLASVPSGPGVPGASAQLFPPFGGPENCRPECAWLEKCSCCVCNGSSLAGTEGSDEVFTIDRLTPPSEGCGAE
jgi:hypothetical protein